MSDNRDMKFSFGHDQCFECELSQQRIVAVHRGPALEPHLARTVRKALESPLEFPALSQTVIEDDRVVLAVEPDTPGLPTIVAEVWKILEAVGVDASNLMIAMPLGPSIAEPLSLLPIEVAKAVRVVHHDPETKDACGFLGPSTTGERLVLLREVIDAEVVISIGPTAFDPILGFRGTVSVFYPGLSDKDAQSRSRGQGHSELEPEDSRPLRQLIDEIAWQLGTQFTVQVIASAGTGVAHVVAGANDPVFRKSKELLTDGWLLETDERVDVVVVCVDADAAGHGWAQVASAIATARKLVERDGRIVVMSQLSEQPGVGVRMLQLSESPSDAIKPLRLEAPADLIPATQLANALEWARVYLHSELDSDLVEELFMIPLSEQSEVHKLLQTAENCVIIESAQNVHGRVV